ncbi:MAG TPA: hypothetical protein VHL53_19500 [Acidimicrobiia bacterium]|nr:hypothetical protein [Acidimicrobiia bacterium]
MRRLTAPQALACEQAAGGRCRCRCAGRLHGAGRVPDELGLAGLDPADAHWVPWWQPRLPFREEVRACAVAWAS